MNPFHNSKVDKSVILATARVHAALEFIPHIVGPKEAWVVWMRDNLEAEVAHLPKASVSSPHPRLLGSLDAMLLRHYSGGMNIKTLCFNEVHADDPSIMGPQYEDVPADALPELKGVDVWWKVPPPSVNIRIISPTPSEVKKGSSNQLLSAPGEFAAGNKSGPNSEVSANISNVSSTRMVRRTARKREVARQEDKAPPAKKKRKVKSTEFVKSDNEDENEAGPSVGSSMKGKAKAEAPVRPEVSEAPKTCDSCNARRIKCVWPMTSEASGTVVEKRACDPCASAKIRCIIAGKFSIRPPRGKLASKDEPPQDKLNELRELICGMSDRIVDLEQKSTVDNEEKKHLVTRIANLELQVRALKAKVAKPQL